MCTGLRGRGERFSPSSCLSWGLWWQLQCITREPLAGLQTLESRGQPTVPLPRPRLSSRTLKALWERGCEWGLLRSPAVFCSPCQLCEPRALGEKWQRSPAPGAGGSKIEQPFGLPGYSGSGAQGGTSTWRLWLMWAGEGTQGDCLYNAELCASVLPLPERGSVPVPVRLVSAADALYRDVSLQVPAPRPEGKGECATPGSRHLSVCLLLSPSRQSQEQGGHGWVQGCRLHLLQSRLLACAAA